MVRYRGAKRQPIADAAAAGQSFLPRLVANKYFVDEAYNFWFVALGKRFSDWLWRTFDKEGVDGIVNGVGELISGGGQGCALAERVRPLLRLLDCRRHHPDPGDLRRALASIGDLVTYEQHVQQSHNFPWLTLLIFLPALFALLIAIPAEGERRMRSARSGARRHPGQRSPCRSFIWTQLPAQHGAPVPVDVHYRNWIRSSTSTIWSAWTASRS